MPYNTGSYPDGSYGHGTGPHESGYGHDARREHPPPGAPGHSGAAPGHRQPHGAIPGHGTPDRHGTPQQHRQQGGPQGSPQQGGQWSGGPGQEGWQPERHRTGPAAFAPSPRGSRPTRLAAIAGGGVALLVGVFAFTAWVAPGFLAGGDAEGTAGAGARDVAQRIVTGFTRQDKTALRALTCEDAERPVAAAIEQAHQTTGAQLTGRIAVHDDSATAAGRLTMSGDHVDIEVGLDRRGGSWCWRSLTVPGIDLRSPRPTG
ncbi:hypothetical protein [Prauserella alba]|uniref:Mce-associated membrane protein n=1 Tax=Prauserella alba TaxID=176898 RepID=A0ABN1V8A0_9PSEU|nr:hypothetical protein [Prauserella alba]MCP2183317.1 hypothetical protein [Prauserella alba]